MIRIILFGSTIYCAGTVIHPPPVSNTGRQKPPTSYGANHFLSMMVTAFNHDRLVSNQIQSASINQLILWCRICSLVIFASPHICPERKKSHVAPLDAGASASFAPAQQRTGMEVVLR